MWKIKDTKATKMKYRSYSPSSMMNALEKVRLFGTPVKTTAREFGIPEASLRHKLSGRVNPEVSRSGPPPIFTMEEVAHFVDHIKFMSQCGYGYSRSEVVDMASEFAVCLERRDSSHPLSFKWYCSFMSRWPELKVLKPRGLEIQRAKAITLDSVSRYYEELETILTKYNLGERPERIYNVDEKGLSTSHSPLAVVTGINYKPPAITSGSRQTVTVIGCGNALGHSVPPFFIFPGARMRQELLEGGCVVADGDVSESGWVNSAIFRKYIEHHLLKYIPERSADNPVLVLYDGHRSHINLDLIDWAKKHHLILFILPAHTSHVLQPLDIGCFGPFERIYNKVCHKFMRENCGKSITRYNICALGCSAYVKALTPENLQSSFRKAGICPFNRHAVDPSNFQPSEALQQEISQCSSNEKELPVDCQVEPDFFSAKEACITAKKPPSKKRRYLSTIVSGKAITEDCMVDAIKSFESSKKCSKQNKSKAISNPLPGPSGASTKPTPRHAPADLPSSDDESGDTTVCCVCNLFTPTEVRNSTSIIFVKWVQCSNCEHWVHLVFCTSIRVVRRGDVFLCTHCDSEQCMIPPCSEE